MTQPEEPQKQVEVFPPPEPEPPEPEPDAPAVELPPCPPVDDPAELPPLPAVPRLPPLLLPPLLVPAELVIPAVVDKLPAAFIPPEVVVPAEPCVVPPEPETAGSSTEQPSNVPSKIAASWLWVRNMGPHLRSGYITLRAGRSVVRARSAGTSWEWFRGSFEIAHRRQSVHCHCSPF